jgi:hypothetical protein|nr:zinc ribbon domain-containing protein [Kofleriaceae bacterium]
MLGLIIFGRRTMQHTAGHGAFDCPRCGPGRQYVHKKVKRWFTLYFIPVIPLGTVGEFVECSSCAATYGTEIIAHALPQARALPPAG